MWFLFDISLANAFICFIESHAKINKNGKEVTVSVLPSRRQLLSTFLKVRIIVRGRLQMEVFLTTDTGQENNISQKM